MLAAAGVAPDNDLTLERRFYLPRAHALENVPRVLVEVWKEAVFPFLPALRDDVAEVCHGNNLSSYQFLFEVDCAVTLLPAARHYVLLDLDIWTLNTCLPLAFPGVFFIALHMHAPRHVGLGTSSKG